MGVRVRIRIEFYNKNVETVALLNTGFEGDVSEVLIPLNIAEQLEVWPNLPEKVLVETYKSASGLMRVYRIRGAKVYLIAEGIKPKPTNAYLVISEYTDETLINDQLISEMGIIIEDPAKGLWKLRGETKVRKSETLI